MTAALFVIAVVIVGAACIFVRAVWLQAAAYCVMLLALVAIWFGSLGHARPVMPLITPHSGTVVAFRLDEPRAIYVWLEVHGRAEPLSLRLPWSTHRAEQLEQAARQAATGHGFVRMRAASGQRGSSGYGHDKPMFYPAPPAPLPLKTAP